MSAVVPSHELLSAIHPLLKFRSTPTLSEVRARALDALSLQFVISSRNAQEPVLDFGCGEGLATAAALARGAHVCALDPDEVAIRQLLARIPSQHHRRLRARVGSLLGSSFKELHFDAVLAGLVLQELDGGEVEEVFQKFLRWLHPCGRLFLSALTPMGSYWQPVRKEFTRRASSGVRWPGYIENVFSVMPDQNQAISVHLFDEATLRRELESAGFEIERMYCYPLPWDAAQISCAVVARCAS